MAEIMSKSEIICILRKAAREIQTDAAVRKALDVLEARVMTPDELCEPNKLCFIEKAHGGGRYGMTTGDVGTRNARAISFLVNDVQPRTKFLLADYGRTWRCWTTEPTEARRNAEPWRSQ